MLKGGGLASTPAKLIAKDRMVDLAILKMDLQEPCYYVPLANVQTVEIGDIVFVIGSPFGYSHSVTKGIISKRKRTLSLGDVVYKDMIQTDADEIQPGMIFQFGSGDSSNVVKVVSVEADGITVDGNHPLAGVTFNFEIHVLEARQAEPGEM